MTAEPDKSKRKKGLGQLALAAALGGSAYGSTRLADWAVPYDTRNSLAELDRIIERHDRQATLSPNAADPHRLISDYAGIGNELLQRSVLGMPARQFLQVAREKLPVKDKWRGWFSAAHYDAFKRSPTHGAIQLLDENASDLATATKDPELAKYINRSFHPEFRARLAALSKERIGRDMTSGFSSLREGLAYQGEPLNDEESAKMLAALGDSTALNGDGKPKWWGDNPVAKFLAPESRMNSDQFQDTYNQVVRNTANGVRTVSLKSYQNLGNAVNALHRGLSAYAPAALGVGAAGLAVAGLYNLFKKRKKKSPEKQAALTRVARLRGVIQIAAAR